MTTTQSQSKYADYRRQWKKDNPEKVRASNLRCKYGITPEQFDELFEAQGRVCAICKTGVATKNGWHIDHCHETKRVRGLLCHRCNLMLGNARDSVVFLAEAISYLKSPPAGAVIY
jgi:hypothetical protein